ncbi:AraC family transcriptional regulator [Paracoccus fistulariae]|uniref:AraC family transcriptional regulator n=1 Tax=Paracoccus fistulariae TaxID=658446 RepID=A0ABY7SN83_9RHOB|nr:AraC family transcriptional regulator [Paracoccus fistulariae]MDB6180382.1 AraC family transcriptional regulator [Paracoccus fistulariae]WCR08461.1 AraC family transcriptional regulator [Paracoccus fistulariae]
MERANITPGFVRDALRIAAGQGVDTAALLDTVGLPQHIDRPVTNREYGRLWWQIARELRCEFFGLGERAMRPGSFDLMCQAILPCSNLERALRRALQFLNVILDQPHGRLTVADGLAVISLRDTAQRPAFAYRAYWLILMGVACWLIGRRIPLQRLDFACPAPKDRQDYRSFFGAPVLFGQAQTDLVFDSSYLSLPIVRSETALDSFLRGAPANLLIRYRHDDDISARIRARLGAVPPADWPGFEDTAAMLQLSPATLRRRLRRDGQSFGAIKDELRSVLAQRLLQQDMTVAEVATELGYSEPSAFHRAYVKWTGQSPGAFKRSSQGGERSGNARSVDEFPQRKA